MSIFKRLENHYKSKSYLTYHAANEHEQLLLFYPNYKSTKIYVIHKSDDSKWFDLGCLERGDDEKLGVSFYDGCDNILIDELTILAESIAIAAILCSFFSNEWSIPQKYNVFIVLLYVVFFVSQILILLRAALTGRYTLKEIIIRRVEK